MFSFSALCSVSLPKLTLRSNWLYFCFRHGWCLNDFLLRRSPSRTTTGYESRQGKMGISELLNRHKKRPISILNKVHDPFPTHKDCCNPFFGLTVRIIEHEHLTFTIDH